MIAAFTTKQGQYLAFIYAYTTIYGYAPSEAEMERFFGVSPPTVHGMVLKLEQLGFITRVPRKARSIGLRVEPEDLPILRPPANRSSSL